MVFNCRPTSVMSSDKENDFHGDASSSCSGSDNSLDFGSHVEVKSLRIFKTSEDYLFAMKEDLAEWLNSLYSIDINVTNFMSKLETGATLCRHANNVISVAKEKRDSKCSVTGALDMPGKGLLFRAHAAPGTFLSRDNVSNFIGWCRSSLRVRECLLFETDDLVLRKNEKSFILCLLEVARKGSQLGMAVPLLVQMEQEIDLELEADQKRKDGRQCDGAGDVMSAVQIVTNDLKSLHERVVDLLNRCTCPSQFPMIKMADGKYRIGDTKTVIFVRILRRHVMVRVGGGWDTLEHYLDKHDPCRSRKRRYIVDNRIRNTSFTTDKFPGVESRKVSF
ncbi:GAS2-like protein 1 [Halotydeus destructor]|nr:GAS2-like protein 1 [Halotydeus destructor]